jgi:Ni,Fe-hydrogenase III large subunit
MHTTQDSNTGIVRPALDFEVGPYDPALPGAMVLRLGLEPGGGSSPLGWSTRIVGAEVELGYNRVGLEERAAMGGLDWGEGLQLVMSLCGSCSQANSLAYVQAVEDLSGALVPPRAAYLRLVLAEAERVASHLLNAADTLAMLGYAEREAGIRDLRERILHALGEFTGGRLQQGLIVYGGVSRNLDEAACRAFTIAARNIERALRGHIRSIIKDREIARRLTGLGKVTAQEAAFAGLRGPIARAAGVTYDIRAQFPTGAYEDEAVTVVVQRAGDAYARLVVRLLECLESFRAMEQALDDLPPGPVKSRGSLDFGLGESGSGIGRAEGPRGEVFCWARGDGDGLQGLHLNSGSQATLGVLPGLLAGAELDDLPLLLLSLDLCLPCAER